MEQRRSGRTRISAEGDHAVARAHVPPALPGRRKAQTVQLSLNDENVGEFHLTAPEACEITFVAQVGAGRPANRLVFDLPGATSPASLGLSLDLRQLAIAVQWIEFAQEG